MKFKSLKTILIIIILNLFSCNEPKTVVTNIVHPDGSVTRRIEIRNSENNFAISGLQVPFDTTWIVKDSLEINNDGDTIWVKRAEKLFKDVSEINDGYKTDSSYNRDIRRSAEFRKRFRWFNTEYRFAEVIERKMSDGYPVSDFLDEEELNLFYSPESILTALKNGADSIKTKALEESINAKTELWLLRSFVSEWITEFCMLTKGRAESDLERAALKAREEEFVRTVQKYDQKFDSLWENGVILREMIGESNAFRFKTEADTAIKIVIDKVFMSFREYSVKTVMPGELISTNGFIDSSRVLLWPVKSDFFLTENYRMWAESKTTNLWAWIVTGLFLLFVGAGLLLRIIRK